MNILCEQNAELFYVNSRNTNPFIQVELPVRSRATLGWGVNAVAEKIPIIISPNDLQTISEIFHVKRHSFL
jgi:hypothetical protein